MRLTKLVKKISFIFTILVCTLIVFCFPIKNVKADNLTSLEVVGYENALVPSFSPNTYEYDIEIPSIEIDLNFNYIKENNSDVVKIYNNKHIKNDSGKITINVSGTDYTINYKKVDVNHVYEFLYTGEYQKFVVPYRGIYKIELWGAQGGSSNVDAGGKGGYTSGTIGLNQNNILYVYVGEAGKTNGSSGQSVSSNYQNTKYPCAPGGWNGGGESGTQSIYNGSGGGATDIRLTNTSSLTTWNEFESLKSRIMVAAGGGGSSYYYSSYVGAGGAAGGLNGYNGTGPYVSVNRYGGGGTQTGVSYDAGAIHSGFGYGGANENNATRVTGGGGSGYYGGAAGVDYAGAGGGGSSYISGHEGCNSISSSSTSGSITHTGQASHYSGKVFYDTKMFDGQGYEWKLSKGSKFGMPNIDGSGVEYGHTGNGYAKITPLHLYSKNNYLLTMSSNHGTFTQEYDPTIEKYYLNLDKYDESFLLSGSLSDENAIVIGLDEVYNINNDETKTVDVIVTSDNGDIRTYQVEATRSSYTDEHSSKLKRINIVNYNEYLEPMFHPLENVYTIKILPNDIYLKIETDKYDEEANVVITGNDRMVDDSGTITITVTEPHVASTEYIINYSRTTEELLTNEFYYTGGYQIFKVPYESYYKIELWGASGGNSNTTVGGKGGYTSGTIKLKKDEVLYVYVGSEGKINGSSGLETPSGYTGSYYPTVEGGWNGGGQSGNQSIYNGSGGGATDIRLVNTSSLTTWNEFESLKSRIMVAGGGGGASFFTSDNGWYGNGGSAGGLTGYDGVGTYKDGYSRTGGGALQTGTGYDRGIIPAGFGYGGGGAIDTSTAIRVTGGGGSGYYGGAAGADYGAGGGGGSSYISGHEGCDSITESSTSEAIIHTSQSNHYSKKVFEDTVMIDGQGYQWDTNKITPATGMPTISGTGIENGHTGNGYAKITPILLDKNNYLSMLLVDKGTLSPAFDPTEENYTLTLGVDDTKLKVQARLYSDLATIEGLGEYDIPAGLTVIEVKVTAESGDERVYKINVTRPASTESRAKDIIITGLLSEICDEYPGYCQLDNEFNEDRHEYYMTVPSGIRDLEFTVDKYHDYQTIIGDGVSHLRQEENTITIEITSEDGEHQSTYTYHITRDLTGDNYLDSLVVKPVDEENNIGEEIDIGFHYLIEEYSFKVENEITSLDIELVTDDSRATYEIIGNSNFKVGNNIVDIEVKANNNEIRTYRLNVYRVSDNNPLLSNIEVKHNLESYQLSPEFRDVVSKYTVTVENEIDEVNIITTTQKNTTTVTGDGIKTLNVGRNTYTITSMAENGLTFTYEVVIIRLKNSNNYLSSLVVSEGMISPTFDKEENEYTLTVDPHIKSLTIEAIPEVETSNVTITGNSNFNIGENIVTVRVKAEDNSTNDYIIKVTKLGSDNNYLSSLIGDTVTIPFDKETQEYEINVTNEITEVTLSGEAEDSLSSVEGLGHYNLRSGNNEITIKVTSETGRERIYTVNIIRDKNSDASLRQINVTSGSITLEEEVYEYELEVENNVEEIGIDAIPTVSTTTYTGYGTYNLSPGVPVEIELVTLAEDGVSTLTYKVTVTRKKNDNAYLSSLSISEGVIKPTFNKEENNYTMTIRHDVESLTVTATPEVNTSTVIITKPDTIIDGENIVEVTVTSESGITNIYKVTVTRLDEEASKLKLQTLDITSCTFTFDPDTYIGYTCEVEYEVEDVIVTGTPIREEYKVRGIGRKDLEVGENVITVSVYDELENNHNEYTVTLTRKESSETRLKNITVTNHTLNEVFNKDEPNYTLNTVENNLIINSEKMHEGQTVTVIGNNNLTVGENIVRVHVVAANGIDTRDYYITVTKGLNPNNYLQSLEVEGYDITPTFTKGRSDYKLTVENEVESVVVNGMPEEATSSVSGTGMHSLLKGKNNINIKVTSESGVERIYTIEVTRLGSRNAYLRNLEVEGYSISPTFDKEEPSYTLEVEYEVEKVTIKAEVEEEHALITGDGEVTLKQGVNDKGIIVTSENGDTLTYRIHITRRNPVTSKLKNIKVENYSLDPAFESDTTEYTVIVDNEVDHLNMTIEKLDPNSTYTIEGNQSFEVGENIVRVISTSSGDPEDKTTYEIRVIRQSYSNTYLSSLTVDHGELEPVFDKTVLSYEVEVEYEITQIDIEGIAENEEAIVTGNGIKDLRVGENNFEIKVSKNNITRTYKVKVTRKGSNNANIISVTSNLGEVIKIDEGIYGLVVPYNLKEILSSNITVVTEDPNAVVSKQGRLDLEESQTYNIRVVSEDGEVTRDYVINITFDLSTNNYLTSLTPSVGELSPSFIKTTEEYEIEVLDTTSEIEFNAVLEDERAEILNETMVYELNDYSNEIIIRVKSEKGEVREYKITVVKSLTRERTLLDIELTGLEEIETDYEFGETTYLYNLTVPYDITNVGFEITKKHPKQKVRIKENNEVVDVCTLSVGINVCEIEVENTYGEVNTYTYSIERLKNTNNYLASLRLISPEIELENFDRERQEYSVTVPYNYENIEVEAIAEDTENARVTISGTTYLIEGIENDVIIRVRAQNGSIREYMIHVLRLPESNNLLKTLTVSSGDIYVLSPKFTPGVTEYQLEVPSAVDLVGVEGLAMEDTSVVSGNGEYSLRVGLNKIEITVTSEDGQERTYKVNVTRLAEKNVYLGRLEITNGTINPVFDKTKGYYEVRIPYTEDKLNMIIETEDPGARYEVLGNNNLKYGENEVRIKVTSSDGSASKTYVLKVIKGGNVNNNLIDLKVDGETILGFDPNKIDYTYEVEYRQDKLLIEAEVEDETSVVTGVGYHSLVEGENTVDVVVVSQSGSVKTYSIVVTRKLNTNLMGIVTDRGEVTPAFDKEELNYSLEVENNIKDITIIGVKESSNSEVIGNGKYNLQVGENEIILKVVNGIYEREYKVVVRRKGSMNTNLKYLTVAESILDKEYSNEEDEYTLYIPDDVTSLSLSYEPEDETSIVEVIGNENFDSENEEVKLKVRSTGGAERIITLHVIRESESTFSNKLLDLSVDKGTMSPRYTEDVQEYTVTVPTKTTEITISAVLRGNQKIEGIGTKQLTKDREEFKVKVTSKDGKTRVYTLIIYKEAGTDARLNKLEFNEGYLTPTFNKNVYNYVLTAESDTKILTIKEIETVDEDATYNIYGTLLSGENDEVRIEVTAPDGVTKKNYIIEVILEKSNNANLMSLTSNIGSLTPVFNKDTQYYEIEVEHEVSNIILEGIPESEKATVIGDGKHELRTGTNRINIIVTAETGIVKTYTVVVNRALSSIVDLKDLYVRGYEIDPSFDKDEVLYEVEVENEVTYVDIDGELADPLSSVIGFGRVDLEIGENICEVTVTAENGNTKTYVIKVTRKDKLSSKILDLVVKEGTLSPEFGKEVYEYTVSIPNEYRKITPIITLEDPRATYNIRGNSNLEVGSNIVEIEVTSYDLKETSIYKLNVIRNISSNNYLSTLKVSEGELTPAFEKTRGYYEVEVENEVESITVSATPEVTSTFIAGLGTYELETGVNTIIVRTMSESGVPRSYQIKVTRKASESNYLKTLEIDKGVLNPIFDKEEPNYEVIVDPGTKEVTLSGELENEKATVTGLGTHTIKAGSNVLEVVVTSESGDINTYKVTVIRPLSDNTNIISFVPETGILSPAFDNEGNDKYTLNVGKDINVVNIDIELEDEFAKVGGNKNITITGTSKKAIITVLAENGTIREIEVTINKESAVEDITITNNDILIVKGEEKDLEIVTNPVGASLTYIYEIENNIIDIEGIRVKGLVEGTTKVTVKVAENPLIEKEVQVTVVSDKIKSNEYEVKDKVKEDTTVDRIVIGAEEGTLIKDFKDNLLNDKNTIKIYDEDNNEVSEGDVVRTGLIIKLENNGVVYDEAIMIVRGDVDGDGVVDVTDESMIADHVLVISLIEGPGFYAADIEEDGIIDVADDSLISDYILKIIRTLN